MDKRNKNTPNFSFVNETQRLQAWVKEDTVLYIPKKKMQSLFKDQRNEGIYYQHLWYLYEHYSKLNRLFNDCFYYPSKKAMEDLNMSKYQISTCRTNLQKDGWIFLRQSSYQRSTRWWIQINQMKLFNEIEKKKLWHGQMPSTAGFRLIG